jgi:hypothetical protein
LQHAQIRFRTRRYLRQVKLANQKIGVNLMFMKLRSMTDPKQAGLTKHNRSAFIKTVKPSVAFSIPTQDFLPQLNQSHRHGDQLAVMYSRAHKHRNWQFRFALRQHDVRMKRSKRLHWTSNMTKNPLFLITSKVWC